MRSTVDWYCVVSKMLRTMVSDLQWFWVERCWDHHIDTLSIKNFKVIKIEISNQDEHGHVIPNGCASRSTRSVRTTIALSFNLNLTLLWYKCRPSSDEKHQDNGPECVSMCWHGQCTHLVMFLDYFNAYHTQTNHWDCFVLLILIHSHRQWLLSCNTTSRSSLSWYNMISLWSSCTIVSCTSTVLLGRFTSTFA